jgi:hypothetical protein
MGIFSLLTPLVHAVGRWAAMLQVCGSLLRPQPGEFMCFRGRTGLEGDGRHIQLDDQKARHPHREQPDNSALNIEFSVKKSIEPSTTFIPSLRTMIATGKENACSICPPQPVAADFDHIGRSASGSIQSPSSTRCGEPIRRFAASWQQQKAAQHHRLIHH